MGEPVLPGSLSAPDFVQKQDEALHKTFEETSTGGFRLTFGGTVLLTVGAIPGARRHQRDLAVVTRVVFSDLIGRTSLSH